VDDEPAIVGGVSWPRESCGDVFDMPATVMRPVARQVTKDYGFALKPGHFALGGRCERCVS
jgi:Fe2+ or Zn2+ uptake regulation protein